MKFCKRIIMAITLVIVFAILPTITVTAETNTPVITVEDENKTPATTTESKSPVYSIEPVEDTLTNDKGETIATMSYDKLVLEGDSQAIRKINESIEKDCAKVFKDNKDNLFSYAQTDYDNGNFNEIHYCKYKCDVTNKAKNILSLKMTWSWYAGGVRNESSYGLTYNLKTGKKLGLSDVVKGTSAQIKNKIVTATKKYLSKLNDDWNSASDIKNALNKIKKYKLSDFKFYLKGEKVYICYDEYELIGNYYGGNIISIKAK